MCTGVTVTTEDGLHFFGRNLDVPATYGQSVHIIPRQFKYYNAAQSVEEISKYACIGMGIVVDHHPLLFDAVNEKGLAGGGLNFTHFAKFNETPYDGMTNVSASDFIYWVLSRFSNLEELKQALDHLCLTSTSVKEGLPVAGLHWMFTDLSGKSLVIECMEDGLHVHENLVGVLTNDPTFSWHMTNLSQYVTLTSKTPQPKQMGEATIHPFGHGLGSCGIPGDASPAARFVRTVFFKQHIATDKGEINGISSLLEILNTVSVTKGSELDPDGAMNFTVYKSAMCQETQTYYYSDYQNRRINAVSLKNIDLNSTDIISYPYQNEQDILYQN